MKKISQIPAFILVVFLVAACGSTSTNSSLTDRANKLTAELKERGLIMQPSGLTSYVSNLGQRMIPAEAGDMNFRFYVLRDPEMNAFALPNGDVYVNLGLLAKLENEMQLAQTLAHEISHIVLQHSHKSSESHKTNMRLANFADIALMGTKLAHIPVILSMTSYSRDMEREADKKAVEILAKRGYRVSEAHRLFAVFDKAKKGEITSGSIWSSHPDNKERAEKVRGLVMLGKNPQNLNGRLGEYEYRPIKKAATEQNLELQIFTKQYQIAMDAADEALKTDPKNPKLYYYRAEAMRNMGDNPEVAAEEYSKIYEQDFDDTLVENFKNQRGQFYKGAKQSYKKALQLDSSFAEAYRGLGLIAYTEKDFMTARTNLRNYLNLAGYAPDKRYINSLLEEMR